MKLFKKVILAALCTAMACGLALFAAACGGDEEPQTVGYTSEVYLQSGGEYLLSEENSSSGTGEVGKSLTLTAPAIEGYVYNSAHTGNVTTLTLSENAAENVFKFYYDAKIENVLVYDANAPQGANASGSVVSAEAGADGKATAAENGFSVQGYRFAGWSYSRKGKAEVQPGAEVSVSGTVTLYAVWDRGYQDRFGGSDLIFLPSSEAGTLVMQRGGAEFRTTVENNLFSFTLPDGTKLSGKLFDDYAFAYAKEDFAGEYIHHSNYWNKDDPKGASEPDSSTKLTLDAYGSGSYTHLDENGRSVTEEGYVTYYSFGDIPEYLFIISGGVNAGSGFVFRFETVGGNPCFSSTNGEAGAYDLAVTPDGSIFYMQDFRVVLDGYGSLVFSHTNYTSEWTGRYWVEMVYGDGITSLYKLHLRITEDSYHNLSVLHGGVKDDILEIHCYTIPLSEDSLVYVEPNEEAGEYTNSEENSTLVLDGFKTFADSAVYTVDGAEHTGPYTAYWSQTDLLTVVMTESDLAGNPLGRQYIFKIDISAAQNGSITILDTFTVLQETDLGSSYRLLGSSNFGNSVVTITEEVYNNERGKYVASFGSVDTAGRYTRLADGYVERNYQGMGLYRFTKTSLAEGADGKDVPDSMVFAVTSTYDSNFFLYDVYYVYSAVYGGSEVKNYTEITDTAETGAKIWYMDLPAQNLNEGAIYFTADGDVYKGRFTLDDQSYYFGPVGYLSVINDLTGYVDYYYFDLEMGSGGKPATFAEISELEYPVFTAEYTGGLDLMTVRLLLRGGEALWSESGDFENDFVRCSFKSVGKTAAGGTVFAIFNEENIELLRFVMDSVLYSEPGFLPEEISVYYAYDKSLDKTFSSADGKLTLDGFRTAVYTDGNGAEHSGNYSLSADKKIVYLNAGSRRYTFDISGTLALTDGVYGTYEMFVGGAWWSITFDGHGNATAKLGPKTESGYYFVQDDGNVRLFINNLEQGVTDYVLNLFSIEGHGEAHIYDENLAGTFVGDDWTVLALDGFGGRSNRGSGRYFYPDGVGWTTVYYMVLDEEIGYINIRTDSMVEQNIIVNYAEKTLSYPEFAEKEYVYYGEDLSALVIGENGEIEMNYTSGYYVFADGVYRAYLMDENAEYYSVDLGSAPVNGVWEIGGKKYYPWTSGQKVTLTGTFEVKYSDVTDDMDASLSFTLPGDGNTAMSGVLKVGDESYNVDLVNHFNIGMGMQGLAVVDWSQYEYSAITEYKYNGNGTGTMKIVVDSESTMTMQDGFERENGIESTLTEKRVGFGPVEFSARRLSGHIFVGNGQYLDFTDCGIETTYYYESDQGPRYNIIFEANGTKYSMQYNKEDSDYRLYLIGTYQTIAAGDYSVGVIKYFYSNGAYDFGYTVGQICDLILYGKDGKAVVAMSKGISQTDGTVKGWCLDIGGYDPVTGSGKEGSVYTMTFSSDAASATVKEYTLMQAGDLDYAQYANFCLDENGNVQDIVAVINGGTLVNVVSFEHEESSSGTADVYTVHLTDGTTLRLNIPLKDGKPQTNPDGTWQLVIEQI